ncbi:hypothetical protein CHELA1G11_14118 [Hyphomicrobiales bacterium]|nr:hypothetical protein CHELA1G2_10195 [Hyphomicrobiales bacterium]CAH1676352.1 hypothetical protein CHELA1G11_14118 [Hyphomicrobiales bacterium]
MIGVKHIRFTPWTYALSVHRKQMSFRYPYNVISFPWVELQRTRGLSRPIRLRVQPL